MSQQFNSVQALSSLPHGPEFRFVDELIDMEPGVRGTASWTLKGTEEFLRGHFPGQPILPGVIMIEALAQLAGVVVQCGREQPLADMRLTAVRQFKILGTIVPGRPLRIEVRVDGMMGGLIQASGTLADEAGQVIGSGSIVLTGRESEARPNPARGIRDAKAST